MRNYKLLLGLIILGCFVFLAWLAISEGLVYKMSLAEKIDGKKADPTAYVYENKDSKYKISVPSNWGISKAEAEDDFESRVEIVPPQDNLKVEKINIDVLKPGKQAMALSTEEEFNKWDEIAFDTEVEGITKLMEENVSGEKVLILADLTNEGINAEKNNWSIVGWFRKDDRNFYVRMFGKTEFEDADESVFRYLLQTIEVD